MIKVYIASPYTIGDVAVNVKRQLDFADQLMNLEFAPFAPLYSHFQHMAHPRVYTDWIKVDLEWVAVCDCVLRLDGESKGADGEVEYALSLGKPVFYTIQELCDYYGVHVWISGKDGVALGTMSLIKNCDCKEPCNTNTCMGRSALR